MKSILILLSSLMFLSLAAPAAHPQVAAEASRLPQIEDFSIRQTLLIEGTAAAYKLTLPTEVYAGSGQDGLPPLAVFNQEGSLVPWQIVVPKAKVKTTTELLPLGFFNGNQQRHVAPSTGSLSIYQGNDSVRINLQRKPSFDAFPSGAIQNPTAPNIYYVDLSDIPNRNDLRKLDFQWEGDQLDDFSFDVKLSGSTDFDRWQPLGSARLVNFTQDRAALKINQVKVSMQSDPYLRIEFVDQQSAPQLKTLVGHFVSNEKIEAPIAWVPANLQRLDHEPGYEFDTGGGYPIHRISILSTTSNSLGEVSLYSFQHGQWVWMTRSRIVQLQHGNTTRNDTVIQVPPSRFRLWRMVFSRESTHYLTTPPVVKFGYRPEHLIFMRQGEGPFTLAYGITSELQSAIEWPNWSHHLNFPTIDYQSDRVQLGEITRYTPKHLSPQPSKVPTTKILFWVGITVFVAVLLGLALHLLHEVRQTKGS